MLNVVVLNGGRGASTLIPSLLNRQGICVTSVVNAYDDGKSTGHIRSFFGMLGPSDIRKVQELMLPHDDPSYLNHLSLFQYRFPSTLQPSDQSSILDEFRQFTSSDTDVLAGIDLSSSSALSGIRKFSSQFIDSLQLIQKVQGRTFDFRDCSLMNCIYAGAFVYFNRNLENATKAIDRLFRLRGIVLPTSNDLLHLVALRENGEMLYSEAEIVELRSSVRIDRLYLLDHKPCRTSFDALTLDEKQAYLKQHHCPVFASSGVTRAIRQADIIIYAAGTQHSSLYPTYMATGLAASIAQNRAAYKVFVSNIGADYETPSYMVSDYIHGAHKYLTLSDSMPMPISEFIDNVLINESSRKPDETYVDNDLHSYDTYLGLTLTLADFESENSPGKHDGDKIVDSIFDSFNMSVD